MCTHATNAAQKQFWFCNHTTVDGSDCFAKHIAWHREKENGGGRGQLGQGGGDTLSVTTARQHNTPIA